MTGFGSYFAAYCGGDAGDNVERIRDAMIQLLPPGRAFSKDPASYLGRLLEGCSVELARVQTAAETLLKNMNPATAVELLPEWEDAFGLPGRCVTTAPTDITERQGALVTKIRGRNYHNRAAYENAAESMGYDTPEFRVESPAVAGGECTSALYQDEWSNVVFIDVPVGDQTADDQLVCTFNELRRSYGALDITLEGPMGATREHYESYFNEESLAASTVIGSIQPVEIKYSGFISIQMHIHNGSEDNPSDTPVGTWQLWVSTDGVLYTRWTNATVDAQLALIATNTNTKVNALAVLENAPGRYAKLLYVRGSGGGGTPATVADVHITTW